jgi:hypothetical protein
MSWPAVHDQIVAVIKGLAPQELGEGLGSEYRHLDSLSEPSDRHFLLEVVRGAVYVPQVHCPRARAVCKLTVFYNQKMRRDKLNRAQISDYEVIAAGLLDQSNYNGLITSVALDGEDEQIPYEIEESNLEITFPVLYERYQP